MPRHRLFPTVPHVRLELLLARPHPRGVILLLEDGGVAIGFAKIGMGFDARVEKLEDLKKVDAVWIVHTIEWKSKGHAMFVRVWPGWTGQRFWIPDERFAKKGCT